MSDYTSQLFARPSFIEGFARIADITGALNTYNTAPSPEEADCLAIRSDWAAIGEDFWGVLKTYSEGLKTRNVEKSLQKAGK